MTLLARKELKISRSAFSGTPGIWVLSAKSAQASRLNVNLKGELIAPIPRRLVNKSASRLLYISLFA